MLYNKLRFFCGSGNLPKRAVDAPVYPRDFNVGSRLLIPKSDRVTRSMRSRRNLTNALYAFGICGGIAHVTSST